MSDLTNVVVSSEELRIERVAINQGNQSFQVWDGHGNVHSMSLIKESQSELVCAIDSSFIEQDIDYPISPYGNGLMVFEGDEPPKQLLNFALINTEFPIECYTLQSHRELNSSDIPEVLSKLGIEIPEDDAEISYSLVAIDKNNVFID